jgi:hypothetical protein
MVLQNYQKFKEMTSNMNDIVAFGVGLILFMLISESGKHISFG